MKTIKKMVIITLTVILLMTGITVLAENESADIEAPEQEVLNETENSPSTDDEAVSNDPVIVEPVNKPQVSDTGESQEKVGLYTGFASVYEKVGTDGSIESVNGVSGDTYSYVGYVDDFYWYENTSYDAGAIVKIKPVAPKLPDGYAAEFKGWIGLDNYNAEVLENNCIALKIESNPDRKSMSLIADFAIRRVGDAAKTNYCYIQVGSLTREDYQVITSVNGEPVSNIKTGLFPSGTKLEIELQDPKGYIGFFWHQSIIGNSSYNGMPLVSANGIFGNREAAKTTYIVPNQSYIRIGRWGGGPSYDMPSAGLHIVDGSIVELDNEMLEKPITSMCEDEVHHTYNSQYLVTVTAAEKESTDEFDYVFDRWSSDYSGIAFSNPTEKTTQFTWSPREIQTIVYAEYKKVPKNTVSTETVTIGQPENEKGISIEGLDQAGLTEQDREEIKAGKKINMQITAKELQQSEIAKEPLKLIQEAMPKGAKLAKIMELNIEKFIDGNSSGNVTELSSPVKIVIDVPKPLILNNQKTKRKFSVIRLHGNKVSILGDTDNNENTVTIQSDKFSYYTLVYQDESVNNITAGTASRPTEDSGKDENPYTNIKNSVNEDGNANTKNNSIQKNGNSQNQYTQQGVNENESVKSTSPKTGDAFPMMGIILLLFISFGIIVLNSAAYYRKR